MNPKTTSRYRRLIPWLAVTLALSLTTACGGNNDSPGNNQTNNHTDQDAGHDASTSEDTSPGTDADPTDADNKDDADNHDDAGDTDPPPPLPDFEWPTPTAPIEITPHESWKERVDYWHDAFAVGEYQEVRWVKFSVLIGDPSRVIYQNSNTYPYHYNFATERLAPFEGMSHTEFDQVSLYEEDQQIISGAVLFPPTPSIAEVGIQLVRQDAYHPEMVKTVFELVKNSIDPLNDENLQSFYFPSFEQVPSTIYWRNAYEEREIPISSVDRWLQNDVCYSQGWAYGRLVYVPGAEIEQAYRNGILLHNDVLLTEGVPAEVPHVAGIMSLTAGVPNSHVAILANGYQIPYVYLNNEDDRQKAQDLIGKHIVLRARPGFGNGCNIKFVDATDVSEDTRTTLREAKRVEPINYRPKQSAGHYAVPVDDLTPDDIIYYGGKASNFGMLRRALPDNSPKPDPVAFSFDLWDEFIAQKMASGKTLSEEVAERLAPFQTYPPQMDALEDALSEIRTMFEKETDFTQEQRTAIFEALEGFDNNTRIRFRSSTNLEDAENFTGAGLYSSKSGCKADDLDDDFVGPSHCNPDKPKARGVFRAIRRVFASFYNTNAYLERLRHGVNEAELGMAMLAHYSDPDPTEMANGVITLQRQNNRLDIVIVTQPGADSVTNPDNPARPEIVEATTSRFGNSIHVKQYSDLLPIGQTTLDDNDEYEELIGYLQAVVEEFERMHPNKERFWLDLEYKKLEPGWLVIRQVREIPALDRNEVTTPILINEPMNLCVFQGESSNVFALHRAKLNWTINMRNGELTPAMRSQSLFASIEGEQRVGDDIVPTTGAPSSWPDASFQNIDDQPYDNGTLDRWSIGQNDELHRYTLRTQVPVTVSVQQTPIVFPSDFSYALATDFATPQPTLDWNGTIDETTQDQHVTLSACTHDKPLTSSYGKREATVKFGPTKSATTTYWWPPAPTGITAGYTAPLVKFDQTVIEGYTHDPITLVGFYSQTYRPQHHNFSEDFYFDFLLEPQLSDDVLDELRALDVRALIQSFDKIYTVGFDGTVKQIHKLVQPGD